jgi:hypothetical protein
LGDHLPPESVITFDRNTQLAAGSVKALLDPAASLDTLL